MNIQKNEFARQWYAKSNYIPFTDEAISFSEALESRNYQEAKFIISQQASLQNPYWYRQLKRLKRILSNANTSKNFIDIRFRGFWQSFPQEDNQVLDLLKYSFKKEIRVIDDPSISPDLEVCSCFNLDRNLLSDASTRILWLGENVSPSYLDFDYSISHDEFNYLGKNVHIPLWKFEIFQEPFKYQYPDKLETLTPINALECNSISQEDFAKRKFCCMFTGNMHPMRSNGLQNKSIGTVDCYGVMFGNKIASKHEVMRNYKFCLTPENSYNPGYITEKLVQCKNNNTIPIYWGGGSNHSDINTNSIILINPKNPTSTINEIQKCNTDLSEYNKKIHERLFGTNQIGLENEKTIISGWTNAI